MVIEKFQENDYTAAVGHANKLLVTNYNFLKFAACVILIKSYSAMNDGEMVKRYMDMLDGNPDLKRYAANINI